MTSNSGGLGRLRAIEESELPLMLSWRNAPAVRRNMYTRHLISEDEHLRWWQQVQQSSACEYFMYEFQGSPLGIVGFTRIDQVNKNASWAFYAMPDAPRGTGSRMEMLALDYAFTTLGLHKLYCEVLAFNEAVIKLHQKFGFSVEGVLRQQHRVDDRYVDIYCLGLLAAEWTEKREPIMAKLLRISGASNG
ncbi:MAG: UDP-4-amino-4,6-dideoxy-N-acetyl-beta-L-altrosamine N-acetyltransferase [Pseudomonadota bacterium]|nr:UDP-4-amino-4,6-dideoxy-N-acetyl-beta-L-altrosamine N-acetyltransferase [Pseudomonadota bacterium]